VSDDDERFGIQSVEVAGRILEAMTTAPLPIALRDLARLAGMHPGKVHRYLVSLTRIGLVSQDPASSRYGIGPSALALGLAGLRTVNVVRFATDALPSLRDETNETALLALWSNSGPVVVQLEESERPVFMNVRVGSILPILNTATGRVFGAYLPKGDTAALLKAEQKEKRAVGKGKDDAAAEIFSEVRRRGYSEVHGTLVPAVSAMAAPIFDHRARISAVIGILGRQEDLEKPSTESAARSLLKVAGKISARLGYSKN
jgi:DNA-binding IclR family transcriptional regulator